MNGKTAKLVRRVRAYLRSQGKTSDARQTKEAAAAGSHRDRGRRRKKWKRVVDAWREEISA